MDDSVNQMRQFVHYCNDHSFLSHPCRQQTLCKPVEYGVVPSRYEAGHEEGCSQCSAARAADHSPTSYRASRRSLLGRDADERGECLGAFKTSHVTDVTEDFSNGCRTDSRNAAYKLGIMLQSRVTIDMVVNLLLELLNLGIEP